jgi:hypothetical protein
MTQNDDKMRAAIEREIGASRFWEDEQNSTDQARALSYYFGKPLGDEVEGRSKLVSWDVFEVVESATPELLEPFFSEEKIVDFEPETAADVEFAKQATEYVNAKLIKANNAFETLQACVKDGLLLKLGILRAWHDVSRVYQRRTYKGLRIEQVVMLMQEPKIRLVEKEEKPLGVMPDPMTGEPIEVMAYDVTVIHDRGERGFQYDCVAPETFIYSRSARTFEHCTLIGEQRTYRASDLVEMGFDKERIDELSDFSFALIDEGVDIERGRSRSVQQDDGEGATRIIDLFYGFVRYDANGDGIAEWRRVLMGGNDTLEDEEVDDHEYCVWTPILVPHRVAGLSYADPIMPLQELNTVLQRQFVDSLFLANNPRSYAADGVNMDDLLDNRIGGVVRMRTPGLAGPFQTAVVAAESMQGLEWGKTLRENRVGILRNGPGLNKDSLNPRTATEVQQIESSQQRRLKTALRLFAEQCLKRLAKLALRDCVAYAEGEQTVYAKGEEKKYTPSHWNPEMTVRISVGLGTGDKSETLQGLQLFGQFMQMVAGQGLPMVKPDNIYAFGLELAKAANLRGTESKFLTDPKNIDPKEFAPKPSPEQMKMQAQMQMEQAKTQAQMQFEQAKMQAQIQAEAQQFQAESQIKMQMESAKMATDASESQKNRDHQSSIEFAKIQAAQDKELLALASGIIAAKTGGAGQNLVNGTTTDQNAQAPGISVGNIAQIMQNIREAAGALGGGMQVSDVESAIFSAINPPPPPVEPPKPDSSEVLAQAMSQLAQMMSAPEEIVRDQNGRAIGKRKVFE